MRLANGDNFAETEFGCLLPRYPTAWRKEARDMDAQGEVHDRLACDALIELFCQIRMDKDGLCESFGLCVNMTKQMK